MGDWRLFFLYRERLRKMTTADVQRALDTYIKPANRVLGLFVPTDKPERADIPPSPDLAAAVADFKSAETVQAGEVFDPTPANIEARVIRRTLSNGIKVALLPKKTRGGTVIAQLSLYWGDEAGKTNRARLRLRRGHDDARHAEAHARRTQRRLRQAECQRPWARARLDQARRPQLDDAAPGGRGAARAGLPGERI